MTNSFIFSVFDPRLEMFESVTYRLFADSGIGQKILSNNGLAPVKVKEETMIEEEERLTLPHILLPIVTLGACLITALVLFGCELVVGKRRKLKSHSVNILQVQPHNCTKKHGVF